VTLNAACIAHLESGGLVLVPDLRQARILRRLHDRSQASAGRQAWPTAQVLPLDAWLAGLWREESVARPELPLVLSPAALRWIWRRQVTRDAPDLLDTAGLGARARTSWLRLRAHGGELSAVTRWPLTRDQQAFLGWSRAVERELRDRSACDAGDLARLVVEHHALPRPGPPIQLAGFRRLAPVEDALFSALAATGQPIKRLVLPEIAGDCTRHCAADPESERQAMLAWLAARLAERPDGLHAAIVPDLDANRGALERALASTLQPALEVPGAAGDDRLFDIAGGYPLDRQPVVEAALSLLACAAGDVDWTVASRLLQSTHLAAGKAEQGARIAVELALRDSRGSVRLGGEDLAARAAMAGASAFAAALQGAIAALRGPRRRGPGDWAEAFGSALAACGWPGEGLGSREFQAARRLREVLGDLATLAAVVRDLDVHEALEEIRRLASSPFQPESGEPAVFVLDAYDDPGVQFDSLWVAGLTATAWPRPAAVDPLLPIEVQRELRMPGVTPEACVADAREVIERWRGRAAAVVLSWPRFENDTEVDGSPLLPAEAPEHARIAARPTRERLAFEARWLEPIDEAPLPPLVTPRAPGGARVLELQAACPFRAFAELRLRATPLEEPRSGFDRRLRGIVLHRALEDLWSALGDQAALAALDAATRAARIEAAVDASLASATPAGTAAPTVAIERDWQRGAIAQLLELDRLRPPFSVAETERAQLLSIGGLELALRIDRLDRIGEELVVIDYKTGKTQAAAWRGARMDAPQLPLYAVLHPDRPTGIAFAAAGRARAKYVGVGRDGAAIAGVVAAERFALTEDREKGFSWPAIAAHWRAWLERLAGDFAAGKTEVDPKLGSETCRLCHLGALCRVEVVEPDAGEADGDDE
jgi:probable DNA repair protein